MESNKPQTTKSSINPSKLYDMCAPAMYGSIIRIVKQTPIADKLLEQVFVNALKKNSSFYSTLQPPLVALVNMARDKSEKTIQALKIFTECCEGATVSIRDKQ